MSEETKMNTDGIDPKKLKSMDELVYARILAGAPDPNDVQAMMHTISCVGACLAQMLADPTPEQAANVKKHLLGHVLVGTQDIISELMGKGSPKVQQLPVDPNLN